MMSHLNTALLALENHKYYGEIIIMEIVIYVYITIVKSIMTGVLDLTLLKTLSGQSKFRRKNT